ILPALLVLGFAGNETAEDRQETAGAIVAGLAAVSPIEATALNAAASTVWDVLPVDKRLLQLLVLSQAILSLQLPFAIVPLVQFTSGRRRMGAFANGGWLKTLAWLCAVIVV